jgi:membrane peptidoglycan carboxypeptidase
MYERASSVESSYEASRSGYEASPRDMERLRLSRSYGVGVVSGQGSLPLGALWGLLGLIGFSVIAGILVTAMLAPALAVASLTAKSGISIFENLPAYISIGTLSQRNQIYALSGGQPTLIGTIYKQNRQEATWADVSDLLKNAAVAGEDRRFYQHGGVDVPSVARAAIGNTTSGQTQSGSSTLDMQVVRNILVQKAFALPDKAKSRAAYRAATTQTIQRKLKEMKLAIGLDKRYSKNEILLAYLNIVGMGGNTYGVEAAAEQYFSVSAKDVSLPQAASLIAIVQSPNIQNLGNPKFYNSNKVRRDQILAAMLQEKYITRAQYTKAVATTIQSEVKISAMTSGCRNGPIPSARIVCDYVTKLITVDPGTFKNRPPAVTALGATPVARVANWDVGGYNVYTSINLDLQNAAQQSMATQVPASETRLPLGGAADTIEVGTGRILVMAQSKLFDNGTPAVPNSTALIYSTDRPWGGSAGFPVGSTYKIYDLANWLQQGNGLNDVVNGTTPQTFNFSNFSARCDPGQALGSSFKLNNDRGGLSGYITVKQALAGSVNTAFTTMAQKPSDLCSIRNTAISMGAHTATGNSLGVSPQSVIGSNAMAPLTVAAEGATIGSGGIYCAPRIIDEVTGPTGLKLGGQKQTCTRAISADVAAGTANAMIASFTNGTSSPGNPGDRVPIAGKTGTTGTAESVWALGTTTKISTVVWTGNTYGHRSLRTLVNPVTRKIYAGSSRFVIFKAIMRPADKIPELHGGAFPQPSKAVAYGNSKPIPNAAGLTTTLAKSLLQSSGFTYSLGAKTASALPTGRVVNSSPSAGSQANPGSVVTVTTSDGSLATSMINVIGERQQRAKSDLAASGLAGAITYIYVQSDTPATMCIVHATSPSTGTGISRKDPTTLTVYGSPTPDATGSYDPGALCPR